MRIDETPFQFTSLNDQVGKVHRVMGPSGGNGLDEIDMAFIDLLGAVSDTPATVNPAQATEEATPKANDKVRQLEAKITERKLIQAQDTSKSEPTSTKGADVRDMVQKEMRLLQADLTAADIDYLKQVVVPTLPIAMGSVPLNTVFPEGEAEISYKGIPISKPLSDMIHDGMKTGRPFRVEVDENSSIVIKIRNGKVSAEFLSSDRAAAMYIKNELDDLRARLASKKLPVDELTYRESNHKHHRDGQPQYEPRYYSLDTDDDDDFVI